LPELFSRSFYPPLSGFLVQESYAEAGTDRRGSWRASKAKGTRRNRRYEKRLLRNVGSVWAEGDDSRVDGELEEAETQFES
jgi:hypothetical protein